MEDMFSIAQADDQVHGQSAGTVSRPIQRRWSVHRANCERGSVSVASLYRLRNIGMKVLARLLDVLCCIPQEVER